MAGSLATQVSESSVGQTVGQWISDTGTCASAVGKYLSAGEATPGQIQALSDVLEACPFTASAAPLSLEQLGVPFVDLSRVVEPMSADQQSLFQTLTEGTPVLGSGFINSALSLSK